MSKPSAHPDETSLLKEIKDLKKRLQALEGQTRLESTSVGRGGLKIKEGGDLRVVDRNNETIGWIGYVGNYPDPEGFPQPGVVFYRNDDSGKTLALSLFDWDATDADGYHQVLRISDRNYNVLVEDDPGGRGLNAPHIPLTTYGVGDFNLMYYMFGRTTQGSATPEVLPVLAVASGNIQHPITRITIEMLSPQTDGAGGKYELRFKYPAWDTASQSYIDKNVLVWSGQYTNWHWVIHDIDYPTPSDFPHGENGTFELTGRRYGTPAGTWVGARFRQARGVGRNVT